jgi:hypothetical protein
MHGMQWTVYLWPGLPSLSKHGSWAGLLTALVASVGLNITLLGSLVWPELIARDLRTACWFSLAIAWGGCAGWAAWRDRRHAAGNDESLFSEALNSYLKGNWFEAERALGQVLRRDGRDVEARLMLATLLRRTKRLDEATRQLNMLVRLDGADKWELEIRREGELLTAARTHKITAANTGEPTEGEN